MKMIRKVYRSTSPNRFFQIYSCSKNISRQFSTAIPIVDGFEDVLYSQDIGLRSIIFNRPSKLNALTLPMAQHLLTRLQTLELNDSVNTIVLSGSGDKAYCAGGDIQFLFEHGKDPAKRHVALDFFRAEYRLNYFLATTEKPIIAYLNGITMGGGVGLSMHGKFVIATEKTLFAMPETAIGFFPDVGTSYLLPRLGRKLLEGADYTPETSVSQALIGQGLGTYLALTGARLNGHEAVACGLASLYLPTEDFNKMMHMLTGVEFEPRVPQSIRDQLIYDYLHELTLEDDEEIDEEYLNTVEEIFGANNHDDTVEGIVNRLKAHDSDWSKQVLTTLSKMSPTSLKVTLELMRLGANKSCDECFQMEFRVASRMMENTDFFEGVRAQILDKDKNPRWSKTDLGDVSRSDVIAYFAPLREEDELVLYPSNESE